MNGVCVNDDDDNGGGGGVTWLAWPIQFGGTNTYR